MIRGEAVREGAERPQSIDLITEAARIGLAGEQAALATVIHASGSTPRHAGAKMIVRVDGTTIGTIGGGRIELETVEAGKAVASGATGAHRLKKHLTHDLAMCCGGEMELWIEPIDGGRWKALDEASRRIAKRTACPLVTLVNAQGGKDVLPGQRGAARLEDDRFVEPLAPPERLVIFGAGHVAHATAPMAAKVGFQVIVCDEDEAWAQPARFPDAAAILGTFDPADLAKELPAFGPGDWVLILTRDHAVDQKILEALLPRTELAYLGLIGSRGKLGRFKKRLTAKGIGDDAAWARLRSPVGLDIRAETPEEIAVAIVAELIQTRRTAQS